MQQSSTTGWFLNIAKKGKKQKHYVFVSYHELVYPKTPRKHESSNEHNIASGPDTVATFYKVALEGFSW